MTAPVLIVGAGIGGLALAQALTRQGVPVRVIENAAVLRPVGAGLILASNALRVLDRLGLGDAVRAAGHPLSGAQLTTDAGRPLQTLSYTASGGAVGLHRAALQRVLAQGLEGQLLLGTTLRALHPQRAGVEVTLSDGTVQRCRAVVGADGLHSSVRALLFGAVAPRYAGYTSWRFVVPRPGPAQATELWGRGCRLGLVPIGPDQTYGYLTVNAPEQPPRSRGRPEPWPKCWPTRRPSVARSPPYSRALCPAPRSSAPISMKFTSAAGARAASRCWATRRTP
ncbi:FAD-dependent monooxygenase [Deinococcus multiflagellatus]|uniref:FAD-dependent monooxygenase n=1 Tax=Deinococcus multiflagellatus TaxID=1656887 RepID=A0ABW1ZE66_9DEIO